MNIFFRIFFLTQIFLGVRVWVWDLVFFGLGFFGSLGLDYGYGLKPRPKSKNPKKPSPKPKRKPNEIVCFILKYLL